MEANETPRNMEDHEMGSPMQPWKTRTTRRTRQVLTAALLVAGLALALPGHARSGKGHHGWGGSGEWIQRHAEELGIDDVKLAEIQQIVDASRDRAKAIYQEHRAARDAMHEMLEQSEPDFAAVMRQAEVIGEIDVRKHKHRLATMLEIRSKLTPEQRSQLNELKAEMREKRGERGGHGCHHCGDRERGDEKPATDPR